MAIRVMLTAVLTVGLFTFISSCGPAPPSACPLPWPSLGAIFEATVDVTVSRGTLADPAPADQNLGADTQLVLDAGTAAGGQQHVLIRFDNLSLVPVCALVAEARLRLTPLSVSVPFDRVAVYQITAASPWTEGTGTFGIPVPLADGATWHTFDGTTLWPYLPPAPARPANGGCFDPTCANTAVDLALATNGLAPPAVDILLDIRVVQGWINGTIPNNGFLLRFAPGTIAGTRLIVGSGEHVVPGSRAQLAIAFTPQ